MLVRQIVAATVCACLAAILLGANGTVEAAPGLQFPWPAGASHRMNGIGHGYNCSSHDRITETSSFNADYWALDFEFARDEPVTATAAGTVLIATDLQDNYGNKVVIDHGSNFSSVYAHLHYFAPGIQQGVYVSRGQIIGYANNTGYSFGDHLHFHMQGGGTAWKPEPLSGVRGFTSYGDCAGAASAYWISRHPYDVQKVTDSTGGGKADAVVFWQGTGEWRLAPSNGIVFGTDSQWANQWGLGSYRQFAGDVNNDGKTDTAVFYPSNASWWVRLSTGSAYQAPPVQWASGHGGGSSNQFLADVNQDGRAHAVVFFPWNGHWYVWLSNGVNGFTLNNNPWITGHGVGSTEQILADASGDLRADAIVYFDVMGYPYTNASWFVAKSNGSIFQPWTNWATGHGYTSDRQFVADVTGDLKADAVVFWNSNGSWYVAPSNGTTAFTPVPGPNNYWAMGHGAGSDNQMLADATGPNPYMRADAIVYFGQAWGRWYVAPSNGSAFTPVPGEFGFWKYNFGIGS